MTLTLVRHGEPARGGDDFDPLDPALTQTGFTQAQNTAKYLVSQEGYDIVYASTMKRARQTAEVIASHLGVGLQLMPGLVEFDFGSQYLHYEDAPAAYAKYEAGDLSPWGTTLSAFRARILDSVEQMAAEQATQGRALAVCHGGVVNAFLTHLVGLHNRPRVMAPAYGSISRFQRDTRGHWSILELNTTPWPAAEIDQNSAVHATGVK
jgi:probable phosphoglycerate mutase